MLVSLQGYLTVASFPGCTSLLFRALSDRSEYDQHTGKAWERGYFNGTLTHQCWLTRSTHQCWLTSSTHQWLTRSTHQCDSQGQPTSVTHKVNSPVLTHKVNSPVTHKVNSPVWLTRSTHQWLTRSPFQYSYVLLSFVLLVYREGGGGVCLYVYTRLPQAGLLSPDFINFSQVLLRRVWLEQGCCDHQTTGAAHQVWQVVAQQVHVHWGYEAAWCCAIYRIAGIEGTRLLDAVLYTV